ncbi:MAG: hypothetical protein ACRC7R_08990, partial [Sarcina sp.]
EGNGTKEAPVIGEFYLALADGNTIISYNITTAKTSNGATVNKFGMISNIGGIKGGQVIATIKATYSRVYKMTIQYLSLQPNQLLLIDVNNIPTGKIYELPETLNWSLVDIPTFETELTLNAGINTITFRGLYSSYAPLIGNITLLSMIPTKPNLSDGSYYVALGLLNNLASYDDKTGFAKFIGGINNGTSTLTVTTDKKGEYLMTLEYLSDDDLTSLMFSVNGKNDNNIYVFSQTSGTPNTKEFNILLNFGDNTIVFFGDGYHESPYLGIASFTFLKNSNL